MRPVNTVRTAVRHRNVQMDVAPGAGKTICVMCQLVYTSYLNGPPHVPDAPTGSSGPIFPQIPCTRACLIMLQELGPCARAKQALPRQMAH